MDAKTLEWIIFGPLIAGLFFVSWWAMSESHKRLDDPADDRTVYLDRLRPILKLAPFGVYRITILRQSGNVHAEHLVTGSAQQALASALSTFRRAKIDAVHVGENSESELRIARLYHDHRGSNEGKKVGKAVITLVERSATPQAVESIARPSQPAGIESHPSLAEPSIKFQHVGITCDCGARYEVAFEELEQARTCASCGTDATLTPLQIAQVQQAAEEARDEALTRFRAGETDILVERKSKLTEAGKELTRANIKLEAAREAVSRLGLLEPEAAETIASFMERGMVEHPRAIATAYRKDGEQLTPHEKRAANIRANAFMSRRAYGELTETGKACALRAHEVTLLRAMFSEDRFARLSSPGLSGGLMRHFDGFKYDAVSLDCPFCSRVNGTVVQPEAVAILPPDDCRCETANYSISPQVDWLQGVQ
jgi:hypothetical protein